MRLSRAAGLLGGGDGWRNRRGFEAPVVVRGARLVVSKKRSHSPRAPREVLCTDGIARSRLRHGAGGAPAAGAHLAIRGGVRSLYGTGGRGASRAGPAWRGRDERRRYRNRWRLARW